MPRASRKAAAKKAVRSAKKAPESSKLVCGCCGQRDVIVYIYLDGGCLVCGGCLTDLSEAGLLPTKANVAKLRARRTRKSRKTKPKFGDGSEIAEAASWVDYEMPACAGCGTELEEVQMQVLNYWRPGFKHVRKYPFTESVYMCPACREKNGFSSGDYLMLAVPPGADVGKLLKNCCDVVEAELHE